MKQVGTREANLARRQKLKIEYHSLYDRVAEILFRYDPIGLNFESNTDEYEPEVGTILPRLRTCSSAEDVARVVQEEFVQWFDADLAGSTERYERTAVEIWEAWQRFGR